MKAFSLYDDTVGYCQGLSFVAALLLMKVCWFRIIGKYNVNNIFIKVPEEQAFYILARLLKGHDLRSFYTEDMRGVQLRMYQMSKLVEHV